jgi:hypothetical protein
MHHFRRGDSEPFALPHIVLDARMRSVAEMNFKKIIKLQRFVNE